ncbi:MAG: 3-hydroxyacyl-CoA dehydrogenase NAD-binding domain-containing protein [Atopobiaceae bacterium]|nr:3-hydroxyacyl-CoA dehydrogenase NAD-binding domain-containing protein [Atopobiaceae bacterium]MCI2173469.1 3-hydroxyacyl-CoA dehydrogenase NAD-binding domain-containing protein [Atopobiaceae bacterium]MCI2207464.1 3-hydroxyacyl-CoA dehydrogenase NAD-binding domain-containing protein [Atopobiaceae bacterium]
MVKTDGKIEVAASIGCGVIGYSWALKFAMAGIETRAYNRSEASSDTARERVATSLASLVDNGVYAEDEARAIEGRITYTTSMEEAVCGAQFIQESSAEHYEVKHELVKQLETYADPDVVIASSTSGLLVTEIAKYAEHPERFCGGHPYNPPHLIPLVEITKGERTAETTVDEAKAFYQAIGMEPVVLQKESLGFICNRLQMALYREVANLVLTGVCSVEDADKAVTFGPGLRWGIMGPSLVFDLGGGAGGVAGLMDHLDDSITLWLKDMATWTEFPKEWGEVAQRGVDEELSHRTPETGDTPETLAAYRDHMLVEMLKLHGKL